MNPQLLEIIACPACKGALQLSRDAQTLICRFDKMAFPIEGGVPVLIIDRAHPLEEA